ncbi:MAG: DUF4126 domain-containing protein [Thermoanaerobaculia bacterium]
MDGLLSVCLGIGLAAACGLRVFVPLLVMSAAAHLGHLELGESFTWIGSTPALVAFAVATLLEVAAYKVPWLDNLLDAAASPIAVVAGVVVSASVVTGMEPLLKWTLAVIAGGGVAGSVQAGTVVARQLSSLGTGGLANPLLAALEAGGSLGLSLVALLLPLLAFLLVLVSCLVAWRLLRRRRRGTPAA